MKDYDVKIQRLCNDLIEELHTKPIEEVPEQLLADLLKELVNYVK